MARRIYAVPVNYIYYVLAKSQEDAVKEAKMTFLDAAEDEEPGTPMEVACVAKIIEKWRDSMPWSKHDYNPGQYTVEEFVEGTGKDYDADHTWVERAEGPRVCRYCGVKEGQDD